MVVKAQLTGVALLRTSTNSYQPTLPTGGSTEMGTSTCSELR